MTARLSVTAGFDPPMTEDRLPSQSLVSVCFGRESGGRGLVLGGVGVWRVRVRESKCVCV